VRQDQKLEALGRLAAGVSHDFNNMLAVILGNVSLLLQDAKQGDASYNDLLDIQDAASRSVEITRQLLLFARSAPEKRTPIDPNAALASMRTLLARLVGEGITLELELVNNAWPMLIDSGELGQAIVNLASNARDAMGGSGKLILRTENLAHPGGQGLAPGDYVCITVQDSGHGMDDATLQRIFEPFFTTKEKGKGTGLGLAVVHGFAQRHGGRVMVHSRLGQGTSFSLYFPRCDANASDQTRSEGQVAQGKGETILVCEDEEIVGRVLERTLARLGYTVMTARNGRELISVVKAHSGSIHLILSDVVMAGLSGPEAVALLAEEGAVPPVLFMSGYADFGAHHVSPLLRKPFVVKELASKIRAMLDA
jgi:CheY-like chemotaxis protein